MERKKLAATTGMSTGGPKRLGRPVKTEGRKSAVSLYLPIQLMAELDVMAERAGTSLSELVLRLVQVGMREEQR